MGFDLEEVLNDLFPDSNLNQNTGSNDAVQIGIDGNVVTIDVYVDIRGDISTKIDGHCVVDLTIQGIEAWGGVHAGPFGEVIAVEVNVHQMHPRQRANSAQNFIPVSIVDGPGVANLTPPSGGWSPRNPGVVNMFTHRGENVGGERRTVHHFINTITHEFGHAFGVNDANAEWRNDEYGALDLPDRYSDRPVADMLRNIYYEIMGSGLRRSDAYLSRHSIQMMIYALMSGDWQRFMEYERGPQSITLDTSGSCHLKVI